mgnify:CR=1 FL=1
MITTSNPMRSILPDVMKKCATDDIPIVSIDVETMGLSYQKDSLLQIGAVKYSVDGQGKLTEIGAFNRYVRYEKHIPPAITAINGIKDEMVRNAEPVEVVLRHFATFCGSTFVALFYNAPFVVSWFKWGHVMYGIPFEPIEVVDAYRVVQDVCGSAKESLKLRAVAEEVSEKIGVKIKGNFNDALYDAMCVAQVFNFYWPSFHKIVDMFPHGTDYPQIINVQKVNPDANDPIWNIVCRFYGSIIFDSYAGTFANEYDCFERLDVNALEVELLKYFRRFTLRDIK